MASDFTDINDVISWMADTNNDLFYALTERSIIELHRDDVYAFLPDINIDTGATDDYKIQISRVSYSITKIYKDKDNAWADKSW